MPREKEQRRAGDITLLADESEELCLHICLLFNETTQDLAIPRYYLVFEMVAFARVPTHSNYMSPKAFAWYISYNRERSQGQTFEHFSRGLRETPFVSSKDGAVRKHVRREAPSIMIIHIIFPFILFTIHISNNNVVYRWLGRSKDVFTPSDPNV